MNYEKFRAIASEEQRREKTRLRVAAFKLKRKELHTGNALVTLGNAGNAMERERERHKELSPKPPKGEGEDCIGPFQKFWDSYPKKKGRMDAERAFHDADAKANIDAIIEDVRRRKDDRYDDQWLRDNGRFVPMPARYLDERQWEDSK